MAEAGLCESLVVAEDGDQVQREQKEENVEKEEREGQAEAPDADGTEKTRARSRTNGSKVNKATTMVRLQKSRRKHSCGTSRSVFVYECFKESVCERSRKGKSRGCVVDSSLRFT
ncbi:hypothetical protein WMY93_034129, partial [Mugilogobius chulae]